MKKLWKSIKEIKNRLKNIWRTIKMARCCVKLAIANQRGDGFIDTGVKILISVVIGALLLAGLYVLFGDTILPTLTDKIKDLFDYAG